MITILGIAGSLRGGSFNRKLLGTAGDLAPDDVKFEVWDGLGTLPLFDEDVEEPTPPPVAAMRAAIAATDGVLITTPEYNGSIPGVLKNAVDWGSRPYGNGILTGKPVAVAGASVTPYGAAWAQRELKRSLGLAGAQVVDTELAVPLAPQQFDDRGKLMDPELRHGLRNLLDELVAIVTAGPAR